ncbi:unnamed protein product [Linum trigynum]|uniref:RNase H type-1 domain-containing protein n=1 Tax=Linum trigynum TaxID=586398 RepID=A0AAV2GV75_9ROSI
MVLMSPARVILLARGIQLPGLEDPLVCEAVALREAVYWCLDNGFSMVRFEGDAQVIIERILRREATDSRVGSILEEVVQLFDMNVGFTVRFVGRRSNRVAHLVAKKALSLYPTTSRFDYQAWLNSRV